MLDRPSSAAEKAQALRQRLGLGTGYVDVFDVLRRLEIEVYRRPVPHDALEGSLIIRDGVAFIFVNSAGAITRQRLTAAHELGHYELGERHDGTEVLEGVGAVNDDREEWEAFRFARHFLMDEQGVRQLVANLTEEEERVAAVAHRFVVSPTVAAVHLAELKVIKRATKTRLKDGFDSGSLRPSAFLSRYGFYVDDMSNPVTTLDAGHIQRSVQAYADGILSLVALAEVLVLSPDEARELLVEAGIPVDDSVTTAG
jgi:Zn-dependent peptidase ImmA (M78 family)